MTKEQEVIDAVAAAKIRIDGDEGKTLRDKVGSYAEQIADFVKASELREKAMLERQEMERDAFSKTQLAEHNELMEEHAKHSASLSQLAEEYAKAFDAVRAYYASVYPGDDPAVSIRRVLSGDDHGGADVQTHLAEDGAIITRIRRGLHAMGSGGAPEALDFSPASIEKDEAGT